MQCAHVTRPHSACMQLIDTLLCLVGVPMCVMALVMRYIVLYRVAVPGIIGNRTDQEQYER